MPLSAEILGANALSSNDISNDGYTARREQRCEASLSSLSIGPNVARADKISITDGASEYAPSEKTLVDENHDDGRKTDTTRKAEK